LEKDPNLRPEEFKMPDFLEPRKRLTDQENDYLHNVMIKLAVKANKYRVLPKAYFKDAVIYNFLTIFFRIESGTASSHPPNFLQ
jgi:hypothetical protein